MTSPPAAPRRGSHRRGPRVASLTRIVQTDELPPGVDALASADGTTIIVRASLDQLSRRRAMREVMASLRRYPRLALYPAVSAEVVRHLLRRITVTVASASHSIQQAAAGAGEHASGLAVAVTAAAGTAAVVTAVAVTASPSPDAGAGAGSPPGRGVAAAAAHAHRRAVVRTLPPTPLHYLGVYERGVPASYAPVRDFSAIVGARPNIALYYSSWHERFRTSFAQQAYHAGATPAVQIEPFRVSMTDIAAGRYDRYLRSYASAVAGYGEPVIIGFAHEPDGTWYPWGAGTVEPATWIRAWRHVVDVFRGQGADNVIWLWTVNSQGPSAGMAAAWWPGPSYVSWIGIDGYFARPRDTFSKVFGPVLSVVSGLGRPVLISETAVGPGTGDQSAGIANLLTGLRRSRLLGLIWFDRNQAGGRYHQNWRLESSPRAAATFRADAGYISS
jgi:mannan endo-1,4-beta-mannosidase